MAKAIDWRSETPEERAEYERWQKRKRQLAPHSMTQKLLNWRYCSRCGLLSLKNDATKKALRAGCEKD